MKTFKIVDSKGRIYLPKELRNSIGIHSGDIVTLEFDKNAVKIQRAHLIEKGDLSPEAVREYLEMACKNMDHKDRLKLAEKLIHEMQEK